MRRSASTVSPSPHSSSCSFSPGPRADELDRDVAPGLLAREPDHRSRARSMILHRLAHVEHVDLAAPADRAGLDDELHRLGDRHEEARHLRVRDRHRAAARDLPAEDRDHAAGRAEHVAEAHGDEPRRRRRRGGRTSRRSTRRAPSTGPSPSSGSTALSVETSTKRFAPNSTATSATMRVAERVVAHRLERVRLHQRRRACTRPRGRRRRAGSFSKTWRIFVRVADVGEHRRRRRGSRARRRARARSRRAPARRGRRARAACGPMRAICRQSSEPIEPPAPVTSTISSGEVAGDRLEVDLDRLAAEHVLDLDGPDLPGEVEVAGDELVQARQRLHRHALPRAPSSTIRCAHLARGGRDRDQHLVRAPLAQERGELVRRAEHADAVEPEVLLARVVVDEPDRRVAERRVAQHLADDQLRRVAGADDDHLLAARDDRARGRALDQRPREQARRRRRTRGRRSRSMIQIAARNATRDGSRGARRRRTSASDGDARRRGARPTCRASRRSATSGCRSRRR